MTAQWYYVKDGQQYGPLSPDLLKRLAKFGVLLPGDLVWKPGLPQWLPAGSLRGLFTDHDKGKAVGQRPRPWSAAAAPPRPSSAATGVEPVVRFLCARCEHWLKASAGSVGKRCTCPRCKQKQFVPSPHAPDGAPDRPSRPTPDDLPTALPDFTLERLAPNLYRCRRADGRPLDARDLEAVANALGVPRQTLTYPAPSRLAGWHNGELCLAHECVLLGDDDTDYRRQAVAAAPPSLPSPAVEGATSVGRGDPSTAVQEAEAGVGRTADGPKDAPSAGASPDPESSKKARSLHELLHGHPVFVDWYLSTRLDDPYNWSRKLPPINAFWARFGATMVIAFILAFTGIGLIVTFPLGIYISWTWFRERQAYAGWRNEVDQLLRDLGQGSDLLERMPRTGTITQFLEALLRYGSAGQKVAGAVHRIQGFVDQPGHRS
jgi:hypothetical protein